MKTLIKLFVAAVCMAMPFVGFSQHVCKPMSEMQVKRITELQKELASAFKNIVELQSYNKWQQAGLIGLTKKIPIKTKWTKGTKLQILYDFLARQHIPVSQPILFRVGYNF